MQNPVSPIEYKAAHHVIEQITPVLKALSQINQQALGNDEEVWAETQKFTRFLNQIRAKNQAVIDQGIVQYNSRPQTLIHVAARRINEIPTLVAKEEKSLKNKLNAREAQADELRKKNFAAAQIEQIAPPVSQAEIDASNAVVAGLKTEAEAIQKFLADAPRYDLGLLAGTSLINPEESAAA
jgi:predicted GNAT family acetyltransferase